MSLEFNFEEWKRTSIRREIKQSVKISRQGTLTLSSDLYEQYFSLEFKGLKAFIDKKSKVIGLKPSNDSTAYIAKPTGKTGKNRTYTVRDLIVNNEIVPTIYTATWNPKFEMVIFTFETLPKEGET